MDLPTFIEATGDDVVAASINVTPRAVASWRRKERFPKPGAAYRLIELAGERGITLTLEGIYPRPADSEGAAA